MPFVCPITEPNGNEPPADANVFAWGRFQVSGITFPTDGCWEITGRLGDASLNFVVLVVYPDGFPPVGTPTAESIPV